MPRFVHAVVRGAVHVAVTFYQFAIAFLPFLTISISYEDIISVLNHDDFRPFEEVRQAIANNRKVGVRRISTAALLYKLSMLIGSEKVEYERVVVMCPPSPPRPPVVYRTLAYRLVGSVVLTSQNKNKVTRATIAPQTA